MFTKFTFIFLQRRRRLDMVVGSQSNTVKGQRHFMLVPQDSIEKFHISYGEESVIWISRWSNTREFTCPFDKFTLQSLCMNAHGDDGLSNIYKWSSPLSSLFLVSSVRVNRTEISLLGNFKVIRPAKNKMKNEKTAAHPRVVGGKSERDSIRLLAGWWSITFIIVSHHFIIREIRKNICFSTVNSEERSSQIEFMKSFKLLFNIYIDHLFIKIFFLAKIPSEISSWRASDNQPHTTALQHVSHIHGAATAAYESHRS